MAPEPPDFDARVRQPGKNVFAELTGAPAPTRPGPKRKAVGTRVEDIPASELRKKALWQEVIPDLRRAYRDICAYLAMRIHPATGAATVDHFVPLDDAPQLAYEWSNYRLCSAQVNTNKKNHRDVLDPFLVGQGWFALDIGTFEVVPGPDLSSDVLEEVEATIARLKLNEPTFVQARAEYHDRYLGLVDAPLPLEWLEAECPFVANEMKRQGRLRETTP